MGQGSLSAHDYEAHVWRAVGLSRRLPLTVKSQVKGDRGDAVRWELHLEKGAWAELG